MLTKILAILIGLTVLVSCNGDYVPGPDDDFTPTPYDQICQPDHLPATIPGCRVCPGDAHDFLSCCQSIEEGFACACVRIPGDAYYRWIFVSCLSVRPPPKD